MKQERFDKVVEWSFNCTKAEKETYSMLTLGAIPILGQIIWLAVTLFVILPDVKRKVYWVKTSHTKSKANKRK